jgi:hypothetical protein
MDVLLSLPWMRQEYIRCNKYYCRPSARREQTFRGHRSFLFVDLAPVRNARHFHFSHFIVDEVDHAVIADADPPRIFAAF